jgi:hypothetical protein
MERETSFVHQQFFHVEMERRSKDPRSLLAGLADKEFNRATKRSGIKRGILLNVILNQIEEFEQSPGID